MAWYFEYSKFDAKVKTFVKKPVLSRIVGLLAGAMIPAMLMSLGLQLAEVRKLRINRDVMIATALRLLMAPAVAAAMGIPFGLGRLEYATGILQAGHQVRNAGLYRSLYLPR